MKPIMKTQAAAANQIIDKYLNTVVVPTPYKPRKLYNNFNNKWGKKALVNNILLPEQGHRCCYCMKKLTYPQDVTVEHIIPESETIVGMAHYLSGRFTGLSSANICHTSEFVSGAKSRPQYPHEVSYHNYAIACSKCNNERRGSKQIDPPFLVPTISQEVRYNRNTGKAVWINDELLDPTFEKLKLNDSQLKAMRAVWIYGKDHPVSAYSTPDTITNDSDKADLVYRTFGAALSADNRTDIDSYLSLLTPHFWSELLHYDYFATI